MIWGKYIDLNLEKSIGNAPHAPQSEMCEKLLLIFFLFLYSGRGAWAENASLIDNLV